MEEYIQASEARKQWRELLDRAANGEVIKIKRGGVVFYLGTSIGESIAYHKATTEQPTIPDTVEEPVDEPSKKT